MIAPVSNYIPKCRRQLPLVDETWRIPVQQTLGLGCRKQKIGLQFSRFINVNYTSSRLFCRSCLATPLGSFDNNCTRTLKLRRQYLITNSIFIRFHVDIISLIVFLFQPHSFDYHIFIPAVVKLSLQQLQLFLLPLPFSFHNSNFQLLPPTHSPTTTTSRLLPIAGAKDHKALVGFGGNGYDQSMAIRSLLNRRWIKLHLTPTLDFCRKISVR